MFSHGRVRSTASTSAVERVILRASSSGGRVTSTYSRSHFSETFIQLASELLEEAQVVGVEVADVVDAVAQQREALDAESPREAGVAFRIVADAGQHLRVHHARPQHLDPAGALAHAAAAAV